MDQCFEHPMETSQHDECYNKWKLAPINAPRHADEYSDGAGSGFDCSICLDSVTDPVVTFCGHLFCWPCIYEWINVQTFSSDEPKISPQCPVCKSDVSEKTLIPLYGGAPSKKASNIGKLRNTHLTIPERPAGPTCGIHAPAAAAVMAGRSNQSHQRRHRHEPQTNYNQYDAIVLPDTPNVPTFGELMYARIFGNQTTLYGYGDSYNMSGLSSPRLRRRVVQMDRSMSRFSFFFLCFVLFCLAVF